jgi:large conductance mechanosensitive channel
MKMLQEFRSFAMKGNVVDLAVGVIIGVAFGKIIASLVEDVIMPLVGTVVGGVNFAGLALTIGWVVSIAVQAINRLHREKPPAPAAIPRQEVLLEEIRDLLKQR